MLHMYSSKFPHLTVFHCSQSSRPTEFIALFINYLNTIFFNVLPKFAYTLDANVHVFTHYSIILSITFSTFIIRIFKSKLSNYFSQLKFIFPSLYSFLFQGFQLLFSCLRMLSTLISHEMLLETTLLSRSYNL